MDTNELAAGLELFQELNPEMQIQTMLVFLAIARRGVCTQKDVELELELGMTGGSASRNVGYWTDVFKPGIPGIGYVDRIEDPKDRRYKLLRLNDKGKAFYNKLRKR